MSSVLEHSSDGGQSILPPNKRKRSALTGPSHGDKPTSEAHHDAILEDPLSTDHSGPIFIDVQDPDGCSSIESALAVPAQILFRRVGGEPPKENDTENRQRRRRRPLLTRQEMEQFLRLTLLAQEMDVLTDLSETVLSRRRFARGFRRTVLMQRETTKEDATKEDDSSSKEWKNPWLVTLGPILDVLEQRQYPQPDSSLRRPSELQQQQQHEGELFPRHTPNILHHVNEQMTRLCRELHACGVHELERSAEQNRSLVASLTDIIGYDDIDEDNNNDETEKTLAVRVLAQEKRALSKLQDHLSKKVRSLLKTLCFSPSSEDDAGNTNDIAKDSNDSKQVLFEEKFLSSASTVVRTGGNRKSTNDSDDNKPAARNNNDSDIVDNHEDDESSLLSLEEAMVPLGVICEELFGVSCEKPTPAAPVAKNPDSMKELPRLETVEEEFVLIHNNESQRTERPQKEQYEHSQRTFGAAAVMMELVAGAKPDSNATSQEPPKLTTTKADRTNGDDNTIRVDAANTNKKKALPRQGYLGRNDDDGSFVEDPPSDGEGAKRNKDREEKMEAAVDDATPTKKMGIFDVVDVLTPQHDDEPHQHLSSLSSQSQTAAEALTRMGHGASFRY